MNREEIENLLDTDFDKFQLVLNRIYKKEYVKKLEKQNEELQERIDKAIDIIEKYNLGKYDYSIPTIGIIELLEILKGED